MRNHAIACGALVLVSLFGCGAQEEDAERQYTQISTAPLSVTEGGEITAPPGDYNAFQIFAVFDVPGCMAEIGVYGATGPLGVRVEDCPECLLPGRVKIGEPIEGFDVFACLPGVQECEVSDDVRGLTLTDLAYAQPVCGQYVAPTSFVLEFSHLDTTEPEATRHWNVAASEFVLGDDGTVQVVSDWIIGSEDEDL